MKNKIFSIKLNDNLIEVSKIHKILAALGYSVSEFEVKARKAGNDTVNKIRDFQAKSKIEIKDSVLIDEVTYEAIFKRLNEKGLVSGGNTFRINGKVYKPNGEEAKRQKLIAVELGLEALKVDKKGIALYKRAKSKADLRDGFDYLNETFSDGNGDYTIEFYTWQYNDNERRKASIVIFAVDDADKITGYSNIINTSEHTEYGEARNVPIHITKKENISEYDSLMKKLKEFLDKNNVKFPDWSKSGEQIKFAANELELDYEKLRIIASAKVLSDSTKTDLSVELLYALGRQQISLNPRMFYNMTDDDLKKALKQSVESRIIKEKSVRDINKFVKLLYEYSSDGILNHKNTKSDGKKSHTLNEMLSLALPEEQIKTFIKELRNYKGKDKKKFWKSLPNKFGKNGENLANKLKLLQQLSLITGYHYPLVKKFMDNKIYKINSPDELLTYDINKWKTLLKKTGVPEFVKAERESQRIKIYSEHLQSILNAAFPTKKIESMLKNGELPIQVKEKGKPVNEAESEKLINGILDFIKKNKDFDITKPFLQSHYKQLNKFKKGDKTKKNDPELQKVKEELLRIQRVLQVCTTPKTMSVLLKKNLNSSFAIASIPRKSFIQMYGKALGGKDIAERIHKKAGFLNTRSELRLLDLMSLTNPFTPMALMSTSAIGDFSAKIKAMPDYTELFGSPDMCECKDCKSAYSPSAYFVDLMRFLKWSGKNEAGLTPLDVFKLRRPDLMHLKLTCENAHTVIPYIDLVNEVMEYFVANDKLDPDAAYDTGDATMSELRANPQHFVIEAYKKLEKHVYPFTLPYHQPLDAIRAYSDHLKTERYDAMNAINISPTANMREIEAEYLKLSEEEYKIFTKEDFAGNPDTNAEYKFYGYISSPPPPPAPPIPYSDLLAGVVLPASAERYGIFEFLHRTGLKYIDVVELTKMKFINPGQNLFNFIQELFLESGLDRLTIFSYLKDIKNDSLNPIPGTAVGDIINGIISPDNFKKKVKDNFDNFKSIITLFEPESKCNLETTTLRTLEKALSASDPSGITPSGITDIQWSKIHRFIRLWRKLGWTMQETDIMFDAMGDGDIIPETISNLCYAKQLNKELKLPINQLAALWGAIDMDGEKSLYKKLFMNKAVQLIDAVFKPDEFGEYLNENKKIEDHIPAILAAFRISREDFDAIIAVAKFNKVVFSSPGVSTTTIETIDTSVDGSLNIYFLSIIYRHVLLSKALKMKVKDFCTLIDLFYPVSGITVPFSLLEITYPAPTASDPTPLPIYNFESVSTLNTLDFFKLAQSVNKAKFKAEVLDYIFNGTLSSESKIGLDTEKALQSARSIREVFNAIELENPDTPAFPVTMEILRSKLMMTFSESVVDQLMGIIQSKQDFSVLTQQTLTLPWMPSSPGWQIYTSTGPGRVFSYNSASGELWVNGMMTEKDVLDLIGQGIPDDSANQLFLLSRTINPASPDYSVDTYGSFPSAFVSGDERFNAKYKYLRGGPGKIFCKGVMSDNERDSATAGLQVLSVNGTFISSLTELYLQPDTFLDTNFTSIFAPISGSSNLNAAKQILLNHPPRLDSSLNRLPETTLQVRIDYIYHNYIPVLKAKLRKDAVIQFISSLIGLNESFASIISSSDIQSIIDNLSLKGFSAEYFDNIGLTGSNAIRTDEVIDFDWSVTLPPPSITGDFSAKWQGYVFPPSGEEYTIKVEVTSGDEFNLLVDDFKIVDHIDSIYEVVLPPNSSQIYKFVLNCTKISAGAKVILSWKTPTTEWEPIPSSAVYPLELIDNYIDSLNDYHRASKFIAGFKLSESEVSYFKNNPVDFSGIDFNAILPYHWEIIRDYVELKNAVPQASTYLLDIFRAPYLDPAAVTLDIILTMVSLATGWDLETLRKINDHFYPLTAYTDSARRDNFKNEIVLARINEVFKILNKTGVSFEMLQDWGNVGRTFDLLNATAQNLKNSVKAKYEESEWLDVAKGISNKLRENQKQALISYLLTHPKIIKAGVKDADNLYEYFLIDVQMGACMDATRILLANTAIQLFVSRILLNLESNFESGVQKGVSPSQIALDRWEWMKNYRVWEANKKVLFYPENWLEPEWRDDRSPFFKELESELVQNDITERTVETAFRNYLTKLDQVSNLDVCGMYQDNNDGKKLHVFGRTHNAPYLYFYRIGIPTTDDIPSYTWTAWEKVQVDIRGVEVGKIRVEESKIRVEEGNNSGVHLVPVVWKNRLFIFWTEFLEKAKESNGDVKIKDQFNDRTTSGLKPSKYWEVRVAWSEFVDGKWSPKQLSKEFIQVFEDIYLFLLNEIYLSSFVIDDYLKLHLYFKKIDEKGSCIYESLGSYKFTNIQAKIESNRLDRNEISVNDDLSILFKYDIGFQKHYLIDKLKFGNQTYLRNRVYHNLLYSNNFLNGETKTVEPIPFFYSDYLRTYLVRSVGIDTITKQCTELAISSYRKSKIMYASLDLGAGVGEGLVVGVGGGEAQIDPGMLVDFETVFEQKFGIFDWWETDYKPEIEPEIEKPKPHSTVTYSVPAMLEFYTFYHPYTNKFIEQINKNGIKELMETNTNTSADYNDSGDTFGSNAPGCNYDPEWARVVKAPATNEYRSLYSVPPVPPAPYTYYKENICFDYYGAYSMYNWELFFHTPLYIAIRLSKNGKYKEAMKWFHYIFDPTTDEDPSATDPDATDRFWKVLPFKSVTKETIEEYIRNLLMGTDSVDSGAEHHIVSEWRNNPFKPHLIAQARPGAYMKYTFTKYIENLVEWADSLFRIDSWEAINEAEQLYVLAGHILGRRPEVVPMRGKIKSETFASLEGNWDDLSNAEVMMENIFPYTSELPTASSADTGTGMLGAGKRFYFCIPPNDKILDMWNKVEDRLYKIRHCMNIEGVERKLALFAPPIDPAMLINAAAKGLSLGSILADLSSPPPIHRFTYLIQKANEFCNEVKSLGGTLLSTLEKKDGEELGRIRASHETHINEMMLEIKVRQLLDAKVNKEALLKSRDSAEFRLKHYNSLMNDEDIVPPGAPSVDLQLTEDSQLPPDTSISKIETDVDTSLVETDQEKGVKMIPKERYQLDELGWASTWQNLSSVTELLSVILYSIPGASIDGTPLGVGATTNIGGVNFGNSVSSISKSFQLLSSLASNNANQASILSGYIRREQDWTFQANLAAKEIIQLDKQIVSADIKIQIAKKELEIHKTQIENVKQVEEYLKNKFTNQELYQWMKEQLFAVYKQSYNLAYDMAKKVEKCYKFETGDELANFVQYGYWDNAMQGLCSGEKLQLALKQMEKSFIENNRREFELTKNISIGLLNPLALQQLKTTGKCSITLPEELFDMDYQGHYHRRIKSVSLTIPCIAGPYTTISCTLRLQKNTIRLNASQGDQYEHNNDDGILIDDERFRDMIIPVKAIATSTAQRDSGMFELNFRDERYLPFEGAGVISEWQIELTTDSQLRQFDYNTISDVILHMSYTAREDGGMFKDLAVNHLKDSFTLVPLMRMFSLKHEFPSEWHKFLHPLVTGDIQKLDFKLNENHFPFFAKGRTITVDKIELLINSKNSGEYKSIMEITSAGSLTPSGTSSIEEKPQYGNMQAGTISGLDFSNFEIFSPMTLKIQHFTKTTFKELQTDPDELSDVFMVIKYTLS